MDAAEVKVKNEEETGNMENDYSNDSLESENEDEEEKESHTQEPLTEEEIEELIAELLEVESKAAEAQEALEEESLVKVEADVRKELAQSLSGNELEKAVEEEMLVFKEEWEMELDELETESAHLLEQLDAAGIELSTIYKWIERQAPTGCSTEAWRKRTHWAGTQLSLDATESVACAEKYLEIHRPVRRRHGKILEEGASGFLGKKIATCEHIVANESVDANWDSFSEMCSERSSLEDITFGSKQWASVYLASTPQQAAELGLKFPGVNEVEEIDDVDGISSNPFVADAIANEKSLSLTEEQKRNFRKVKEEDDANDDLKLHIRMKRRRRKMRSIEVKLSANGTQHKVALNLHMQFNLTSLGSEIHSELICCFCYILDQGSIPGELSSLDGLKESQLDVLMTHENNTTEDNNGHEELHNSVHELSIVSDKEKVNRNSDASASPDSIESRGFEHLSESDELCTEEKECCTGNIDSEALVAEGDAVSSSDSGSADSDADVNVNASTKRRKKKLRRILDDAELGEETKKKIAIEKERQERLISLGALYSTKSVIKSSMVSNGISFDGAGVEVLGNTTSGYIINLVREEGEEAIAGIRFMWENIIQSVRKVRSGDKGLGCILAHTMGLVDLCNEWHTCINGAVCVMWSEDGGFEWERGRGVIAFLYTVMRSVNLGLKTALVVTPVSVLHNWRNEFMKWRPCELKPLRILMLEDVPRDKRVELLTKWTTKGGVLLIGYAAFRNLSLGKYVKDQEVAREISRALQDGPDILVCDEAHIIKNTRADATQALKQVKCQRRIALTGSPLQNNLMEYYCPSCHASLSSFVLFCSFQNPIENGQHTNSTSEDVKIMNQRSHILYEQLKGFVHRMDTSVVKNDLPPKTVFVISVKLSPLQRKLYKRFLDVHGFTKDKASGEKRSFFAGYQALAQIWNHPGILQLMKENKDPGKYEDVQNCLADDSSSDENVDCNVISGEKLGNPHRKNDNALLYVDWWRDLLQENNYKELDYSGKMVLLLDILTMCSEMGDKALVFSQSLLTLDLIEFYLSNLPRPRKNGKCWEKGKDWYRLDGRTESSERQKLVERFNEPSNKRVKCTLISTRAGSLGINLPSANRVIIVDGSWNPTYDLQAIFRVWRYGQTKPVFAYRLLAHATMEEKIYKRQVTKEGLAARVVDRQQVHRTMSKEEMLHLFDFGDDEIADIVHELGRDQEFVAKQNITGPVGNSSDKLIQSLISRHHPSWISSYHEHETLLQENEDEKLSKEEQDLAWEVYRKSLNCEEPQRVSPCESILDQHKITVNISSLKPQQTSVAKSVVDRKPVLSTVETPESDDALARAKHRHQNHFVLHSYWDFDEFKFLVQLKLLIASWSSFLDDIEVVGDLIQVNRGDSSFSLVLLELGKDPSFCQNWLNYVIPLKNSALFELCMLIGIAHFDGKHVF
ncbi:hypothetical protein DH2020_028492 [Rehmannia glutinosa]|uniref:Uncharacterized protein n=1 Tax=Rehmannia glutinosa TaxID=99300 RepID=A0ABR0VUT8_REHGL